MYSVPEKSLTGTVVLMVDRSEFVNSKPVTSALLEVRERDDEESVAVAVVETSVPVPVSSCARTASAARHSIHTGRDNMIATVLNQLSRRGEIAGSKGSSTASSRQSLDRRLPRVSGSQG